MVINKHVFTKDILLNKISQDQYSCDNKLDISFFDDQIDTINQVYYIMQITGEMFVLARYDNNGI